MTPPPSGSQPGTGTAPPVPPASSGTQAGTQSVPPNLARGTQPGTEVVRTGLTQPGTAAVRTGLTQPGTAAVRTGATQAGTSPPPPTTTSGGTVVSVPPTPPALTQLSPPSLPGLPGLPGIRGTQAGLSQGGLSQGGLSQLPRVGVATPSPASPRVTLSAPPPPVEAGDSQASDSWQSLASVASEPLDPDAELGADPEGEFDERDEDERDQPEESRSDAASDAEDPEEEEERGAGAPTSIERNRSDSVVLGMSAGQQSPRQGQDASEDDTRDETPHRTSGDGPTTHSGSGSLHPRRDALFGQVLADRYRVLDLIGKGGMGKVYLAEHVALGKRVAVKVLNQAYTHRPDQVKRFLREAQAASKIGHENVIDVIDFGEMANGSVFFAMEHLQGEDLGKLLRRSGALTWSRARRILLQICRALQAAHAKGILHRDMKPENCFIIHRNGMRDFVKVLDFGIAKVLEENRQVNHTLTQAGALIGTPEYMAPEQVQGEVGDVRMDIYALGCIMYQLLTGQLPFSDKTMFGVLSQQVNVRPVPPRQLAPDAEIPVEVETIILKAMEKDRALRFQSMAELIEAIVAAPRGTPDGRAGTTSNLDAAASAARIAAAMNAASQQALAGSNVATPQDISLHNMSGPISGSGTSMQQAATASAGQWPGVVRDPQMLTKLVIGLVAMVLVLLVGLVCALNRGKEEPVTTAPATVVDEPVNAPAAEPPPQATPTVTPPTVPVAPITPGTEPVKPAAGPDIVVDDEPAAKTPTPTVKDPAVKKPVKSKDGGAKPAPLPEPTLERLEPFDQRRALAGTTKDVETCRAASSAPRGSVAIIKFRVDGATGRVLEATPTDATAAARCIAKVVKAKVRFPRFKQKAPQDFSFRFQM